MLYHGIINLMGGVIAPQILERLNPLFEEETLNRMLELIEAQNAEALTSLLSPFLLPLLGLMVYEAVMFAAMIGGIVYFVKEGRRLRLRQGLLPVPRECRVSAVLLNVGTAAALTVFAGIFLLSLL
jgi:hypothetical protein